MSALLSSIVDDYIDKTNAYQPVGATARGFHDHNGRLGDRSISNIEARAGEVRKFLEQINNVDRASLVGVEPFEADVLERRLRWELTDIEQARTWQRGPGTCIGTIGSGCNALIIRDFAPLDVRLRSLASRLEAVPDLLNQAQENLLDPTRYHVETAIEAGGGIRALFLRDIPQATANSDDASVRQRIEDATKTALAAIDGYVEWLSTELMPRANENYAWGADLFRKLLSQTDSIDDSLESLIARGDEDLRAHQALLREVAAKIDATSSPAAVVDAVSCDHPAPADLLSTVQAVLEELRQFSIDAGICTMPTEVRIRVRETPGFSRMTTQAACSTPGPFESVANEAYYYVTSPDESWPDERIESYMKFFNRWGIARVSAHEAYPGYYVHLTYLHLAASRAGRYLLSTATIEGWAHYVEQLMQEHGYGDGDLRGHLMQIRDALLRLCRYRCAFGLHVEGWSVQQAIDFFMNEGYATNVIAERETRRGILGPNYYAYTMGKHQILALREKMRARDRGAFDERRFHDELMQLPFPVASIEQIMLSSR